jgi:hypothetical protein
MRATNAEPASGVADHLARMHHDLHHDRIVRRMLGR